MKKSVIERVQDVHKANKQGRIHNNAAQDIVIRILQDYHVWHVHGGWLWFWVIVLSIVSFRLGAGVK